MTSEEGHLSDEDGRTPGERRLARVRHSTQPFGDVEWISSGFRGISCYIKLYDRVN